MPHYDIKQELPILKGGDDSTLTVFYSNLFIFGKYRTYKQL